ncbi:MAG: hypothetical protein KJ601_08055 [Nanoarchaeota archaeon]|nr:hypothetical protein [Nanoarchaeota archaeon]
MDRIVCYQHLESPGTTIDSFIRDVSITHITDYSTNPMVHDDSLLVSYSRGGFNYDAVMFPHSRRKDVLTFFGLQDFTTTPEGIYYALINAGRAVGFSRSMPETRHGESPIKSSERSEHRDEVYMPPKSDPPKAKYDKRIVKRRDKNEKQPADYAGQPAKVNPVPRRTLQPEQISISIDGKVISEKPITQGTPLPPEPTTDVYRLQGRELRVPEFVVDDFPIDHIDLLCPEVLEEMLEKAGFNYKGEGHEVVTIKDDGYDLHLIIEEGVLKQANFRERF